jgi:hypothetical protein
MAREGKEEERDDEGIRRKRRRNISIQAFRSIGARTQTY